MMLDAKIEGKVLQDVLDAFKISMERTTKRIALIRKIEAAGLELVSESYLPSELKIDREQLPMLRKIVGRIKIEGKCLAWDYKRTGNINVTVKPTAKEWEGMSFVYNAKLRDGGKCRVEEHTAQAYTYETLVCAT